MTLLANASHGVSDASINIYAYCCYCLARRAIGVIRIAGRVMLILYWEEPLCRRELATIREMTTIEIVGRYWRAHIGDIVIVERYEDICRAIILFITSLYYHYADCWPMDEY